MSSVLKIDIKDMEKTIMDMLKKYGDRATEVVREEAEDISKKAVKELKANSPVNKGTYKKGWTKKVIKTHAGAQATVYNKDRYQLTHLLENGHYKRDGDFWKPEKKHIEPVNEEIQKDFVDSVSKRLAK